MQETRERRNDIPEPEITRPSVAVVVGRHITHPSLPDSSNSHLQLPATASVIMITVPEGSWLHGLVTVTCMSFGASERRKVLLGNNRHRINPFVPDPYFRNQRTQCKRPSRRALPLPFSIMDGISQHAYTQPPNSTSEDMI